MTVCAGTQIKSNASEFHPVWEKVLTFACVAADETASITIPIEGILQKIIYKRPNTTNDNLTSVLTIADAGDNNIFTSEAALAENASSKYNLSEPIRGECDVLITFNEAVGVSATFTVTLRGVI